MSADDRSRWDRIGLEVAGALGSLAVIGGALTIVGGVLTLAFMRGSGGLGAAFAMGLAIGLVILGGIALGTGFLLHRGIGAIASAGPGPARPTPSRVWISRLAVVSAAAFASAPAVAAAVVASTVGPDAVPAGTEALALIAIAMGLVSVAAAWTSRHVPSIDLATALLLAAVLPGVIPAWTTTQVLDAAAVARTAQEYRDRYADLADGPSVGEIVAAVGEVGSWQAIGGAMNPFVRSDEWVGNQQPLVELAGRPVRLVLLGQCRVEGAAGELLVAVQMRSGDGENYDPVFEMRVGPCDGTVRVAVSDVRVLPDWSSGATKQALAGDWLLLGFTGVELSEGSPTGERASRWLVYVSPDPTTSEDELLASVAAAAGTFDVRYSE